MRCAFCGKQFDEQSAQSACRSCSVFHGCKMVKCPHCGYETPAEPGLIKWIRKKLTRTS